MVPYDVEHARWSQRSRMMRLLKVGIPRTGGPRTTCCRWRREDGCPASVGAVGALSLLVMKQKSGEIIKVVLR